MAAGDVEVNITSPNARAGAIFDGSNDYLQSDIDMNNSSMFTLELWLKPDVTAGNMRVIAQGTDFYIRIGASNNFNVQTPGLSDTYIDSGNDIITDLVWQHIVFTYDGHTKTIYINGDIIKSESATGDISISGDFRIGGYAGGDYFNGTLSEIRIYNKGLSSDEVSLAYKGEIPRDSLISEYLLNEDYTDTTGNYDATNNGSRLGIVDQDIAASIKADRTTANDIYLLVESANGEQVISTVIEEAP